MERSPAGVTSDQAALERAGKKQVLKVYLNLDTCHPHLADCCPERMELLGRAWVLERHLGYLGGYFSTLPSGVHQWRSCVRCLWLHCFRARHSDDRRLDGGDGVNVSS